MSLIVRGGATNAAGSISPSGNAAFLSAGISTGTFALPWAALRALCMQALTAGRALALHASRSASLTPFLWRVYNSGLLDDPPFLYTVGALALR